MQDNRVIQPVSDEFSAGPVAFNDADAGVAGAVLQHSGQRHADCAATNDDDAVGGRFVAAEDRHGAGDVPFGRQDINLIAAFKMIAGEGGLNSLSAPEAEDKGVEGAEQLGQLAQRRVHNRAVFVEVNGCDDDLSIEKFRHISRRWTGQAIHGDAGDLSLW